MTASKAVCSEAGVAGAAHGGFSGCIRQAFGGAFGEVLYGLSVWRTRRPVSGDAEEACPGASRVRSPHSDRDTRQPTIIRGRRPIANATRTKLAYVAASVEFATHAWFSLRGCCSWAVGSTAQIVSTSASSSFHSGGHRHRFGRRPGFAG